MKIEKVADYNAMSARGAEIIYEAVVAKLSKGESFNLGLATGNTMIELYRILAEKFNNNHIDLSRLQTWNLDEYASDEHTGVPHDHPLSYWKYMHDNLFNRFLPERNFAEKQAHFPDPANPAIFDKALAAAGGLDLQLLGIGFNGHIAFNEPMEPQTISVKDFADLPSRVIALKERTINANAALTANGSLDLVPRYAATMGMRQILASKRELLLACFAEQEEPLTKILADKSPTPFLPASYLLPHADFTLVYTDDKINLDSVL
ncbi:MAG: 6-phosphogluconolactonase [Victivallales bacterium]|nr:6-phosphogluconolactonase [Victivallales bacterium]MBR5024130.1 6-phosphogluconolactonase [Victivallales bacterium]